MQGNGDAEGELRSLQHWFHLVVTHPAGVQGGMEAAGQRVYGRLLTAEEVVTASRSLSGADRLSIYAQAYFARLLECLGEVYPMLKRCVGDEVFHRFAFEFLQQYPSRSYTLHELGRHFPQYLDESRPRSEQERNQASPLPTGWPEFLVELACLEWAIYEIFDGPGMENRQLLRGESLLALHPEQWPGARLRPVPCLRLLATRFPVNRHYTELRRTAEPVAFPEAEDCFVALTRRDFVVRRYELARAEHEVLGAICEGATVGEALRPLFEREQADLDRAAADVRRWFMRWASEGFFEGIDLESNK